MGTIALTYNGGFTSMTLHDLITLQILPDRNIGVQYIRYTNEYIRRLQIHQHIIVHLFLYIILTMIHITQIILYIFMSMYYIYNINLHYNTTYLYTK